MSEAEKQNETTGKKGRPTPKRKDAQARNSHPLVPADRKEAKRQARAQRDAQFKREQMALETCPSETRVACVVSSAITSMHAGRSLSSFFP